jgi:hypothetical protein
MGLGIHAFPTIGGDHERADTWQAEDIIPEAAEDSTDSVVN